MNTRPETGNIVRDMEMFIERSPNDMRNRSEAARYVPVLVTAVGPKFITVRSQETIRSWRIGRDNMRETSQYSGSNAALVTPEQRAWDIRQRKARQHLTEQGLLPSLNSPWNKRLQELADLVRAAA